MLEKRPEVLPVAVEPCTLCLQPGPHDMVSGADAREYFLCGNCRLIFVDPRHHLSRDAAEAHYRTHENHIENQGYVKFLRRVIDPLLPYLSPRMRGVDFGCGPGPTLSLILRQQGLNCTDYDPIFAPVNLHPPYDYIFATECFEHFLQPAVELPRLAGLLRPGGYLGVMTELWTELSLFENWYYTRDPTHVSFFHEETINFVCERFGFTQLPSSDRRALLFQRTETDLDHQAPRSEWLRPSPGKSDVDWRP